MAEKEVKVSFIPSWIKSEDCAFIYIITSVLLDWIRYRNWEGKIFSFQVILLSFHCNGNKINVSQVAIAIVLLCIKFHRKNSHLDLPMYAINQFFTAQVTV